VGSHTVTPANNKKEQAGGLLRRIGLVSVAMVLPGTARADAPLNYLFTHGIRAQSISRLTWFTIAVSILVIVIVTALMLAGIWRRREVGPPDLPGEALVERPEGGVSWIYVGVALTTGVLFATMVWTFVTLADTSRPPETPALQVEITGHQWWWEARYLSDDPSQEFTTANEIRIPVGKVVAVKLRTADVIHSFWVPALTGKTDLIPGQQNESWLQAEHEGVYRGQCGEYCGEQHAHMGFEVVASPPDQFEQWRQRQLQSASSNQVASAHDGEAVFTRHCGICHTVRGTSAGGIVGPDLTHVMSRAKIAAATLPNNPGWLAAWIADPQHIKPGNLMPRMDLSGPQMAEVRDYVQSLK
jgi:cytochrome c oxidase subunit II